MTLAEACGKCNGVHIQVLMRDNTLNYDLLFEVGRLWTKLTAGKTFTNWGKKRNYEEANRKFPERFRFRDLSGNSTSNWLDLKDYREIIHTFTARMQKSNSI